MDISNPRHSDYDHMNRPDVLIHLAWGGLPNYLSLHHYETELPNHYNFLKNLIDNGLPKVVIAGTCLEYGMQCGELQESDKTFPCNPYGFAKDTLRRELEFLQKTRSFSLIWTRLFYTYGEGQSKNALFPQLKEAVDRGDRIFNMSGGEQLRDYLPVEEIAERLVFLALYSQASGIYNICSGRPISVHKLVEKWVSEHNFKIKLNLGFFPYPEYEPMAFWGSTLKLQQTLEEAEIQEKANYKTNNYRKNKQ